LGKPFETEISALPKTYAWAMLQPIDGLCRAVERLRAHPMLAVGSGGSFSVCHYASHLHGLLAGQPALPMTPLQAADLAGICEGFYLTAIAGKQQGIDPGRPGVPSFGRKLYHANAFRASHGSSQMPAWKARAIERKASVRIERLAEENRLPFWTNAIVAVLDSLGDTRFCGIVFDYDGTLCSEDQRFDPLSQEMGAALASRMPRAWREEYHDLAKLTIWREHRKCSFAGSGCIKAGEAARARLLHRAWQIAWSREDSCVVLSVARNPHPSLEPAESSVRRGFCTGRARAEELFRS